MSQPSPTHVPNGIGHFDVAGPDLKPLSRFYQSVFGWKVEPQGPGYALVTTPAGSPDGALVESEEPSLTVGIVVPSLERALETAVGEGGSVEMPPTDNGWVRKARVRDPAGNALTLIEGKHRAR